MKFYSFFHLIRRTRSNRLSSLVQLPIATNSESCCEHGRDLKWQNPKEFMKRTRLISFLLLTVFVLLVSGCSSTPEQARTQTVSTAEQKPLPPPVKCQVERIGSHQSGSYEYVSVKCIGENTVRSFYADTLWDVVRAGDTVVITPSSVQGQVTWSLSVYFAEAPHTPVVAN
jgi:hypothetical protein